MDFVVGIIIGVLIGWFAKRTPHVAKVYPRSEPQASTMRLCQICSNRWDGDGSCPKCGCDYSIGIR